MHLVPKERERLLIFMAAELARRRKERGVALNHPEAVAYITDWICERARDGEDVATVSSGASSILGPDDVMDGVPAMIDIVQVEPVFPDGTKLVTVYDPVRGNSNGDDNGNDDINDNNDDTNDDDNDTESGDDE